jgi:pilus assembly protein CpaE
MLRTVIICPDRELGANLERGLEEAGGIGMLRNMDRYPSTLELQRFVRAHPPDVIFLGVQSMDQVSGLIETLASVAPGTQIVAIDRLCDPKLLLDVMRTGIREFIALPFQGSTLIECLIRVKEVLDRKPTTVVSTDLVYSFLPSKAGVGASTLALNTAVALSRMEASSTFLSDFDLNSGMLRFMLKLENPNSIVEAAEHAVKMDENLWPQLVSSVGNLDVLHAGKLNPGLRIEGLQMRNLLDFTRRNYKVVCTDHSGNLEKYSLEIMHESKRIFLVCTEEIPSLYLAREKYQYLQSLDLGGRVTVLLNRCQRRPLITAEQIEQLLGLPVDMSFPNDYQSVHKALAAGTPIDMNTDLGRQCTALAQSMVSKKQVTTGPKQRKRFVEYFAISPAKYTLENHR